jgi:hypothetical protein
LAYFVIAAAVVTVGVLAVGMSTSDNHPTRNDSASAATTSTPMMLVEPSRTQPVTVPRGSHVAAAEPAPSMLNKGADRKTVGDPVNIGDCIGSGDDHGAIRKSACGTADADYLVFAKADANAACPADSDHTQPETLPDGHQDMLCLDYDWVAGGCMNLADGGARPVDCAAPAPGPGRVRVLNVVQNTTDANTCAAGDRAFVYNQRRFVVCITHL